MGRRVAPCPRLHFFSGKRPWPLKERAEQGDGVTGRERFRETMRYGTPDRVPYFEEGLRDDVLERWHAQGLPKDADLSRMFHTDRRERVPVSLEPRPAMKKWPASRRGLKALRRRLDPADAGRFPEDWPARVGACKTRDHLLELPIHRGFFQSMGVGGWARFEQVIWQLSDCRSLVREIMDIHGEFAAALAERVLRELEVDFASFSEPIGGNEGPLLSPRTYEEIVLPSYRPVLDVLRRHGVETIVFVTYANARVLVPSILKAGFNCLWACEVNAEAMDYRALRREFGRDLRLIGGIDLDTLLLSKAAIRREMEEKLPPLLDEGGYVPLADGRVRANIPFENYAYYRRLLEKITQRHAHD
jgi:uroporphyrinogen decarboxylase